MADGVLWVVSYPLGPKPQDAQLFAFARRLAARRYADGLRLNGYREVVVRRYVRAEPKGGE